MNDVLKNTNVPQHIPRDINESSGQSNIALTRVFGTRGYVMGVRSPLTASPVIVRSRVR